METIGTPLLWFGFVGLVLGFLAVDLGIFNRKAHEVRFKEALTWSIVWISTSLLFNLWIWHQFGGQAATEFLTGYLIEKSLSVDNIFVFVIIFAAFKIPAIYQHRILFWGILTALVLRAAMILGGVALLEAFHWMIYVFGGLLVVTGIKMYLSRSHADSPGESRTMRVFRRLIPSTTRLDGQRFFTRENGRRVATPLFLTLLLVEVTDVVFALDSIPAIFGITRDPFIVFTSNVFAILGLRALFFLLAGAYQRFAYLKVGLAAILVFVGSKMLIVEVYKVPTGLSLGVIGTILAVSITWSWIVSGRRERSAARLESAHPVVGAHAVQLSAVALENAGADLAEIGDDDHQEHQRDDDKATRPTGHRGV